MTQLLEHIDDGMLGGDLILFDELRASRRKVGSAIIRQCAARMSAYWGPSRVRASVLSCRPRLWRRPDRGRAVPVRVVTAC